MSDLYMPEPLLSTKRIVLPDGTIQIGETLIEGGKVGNLQVGRGEMGAIPVDPEKRSGKNIFKANAIEEIAKRPPKPDGTYDIGYIGKMTGVTQKDIENYNTTVDQRKLARAYNKQLREAGAREVQWGDTELTAQNLIDDALEKKKLQKNEPKRLIQEERAARSLTRDQNRGIRDTNRVLRAEQTEQNRYNDILERQNRLEERELYNRDRDRLDRIEQRRENMLMRKDNLQFQYAQLAQLERQREQDRRDKALMMLLQGFQNLGEAFTI